MPEQVILPEKAQSQEYHRRSLLAGKAELARKGVVEAMEEAAKLRPAGAVKRLQAKLAQVYLRLNELPAELVKHRDECVL